jgi:hypothetical protein
MRTMLSAANGPDRPSTFFSLKVCFACFMMWRPMA